MLHDGDGSALRRRHRHQVGKVHRQKGTAFKQEAENENKEIKKCYAKPIVEFGTKGN